MLLVLGLLFFVGGIRQNKTIVSPDSITTSIHVISIAILLLSVLLRPLASPSTTEPSSSPTKCLTLSLTTSVFLLVLFATYIFLRLRAPTSPPKSLEDISDHIERCGPQGGSPTSRPRIPSASTFTTLSPTPTLLPSQSFSSISRLQPILTALLFATSSFLFTLCAYTLFSIVTDPTSSHILPHRFTTAVLLPLLAQPLRIFHGLYTVLHDHSLEIATATVATSNVTLALFDLPILSLAGWIFKHNDVLVPSHGRKAGLADDVYDGAVLLVAVVVAGFVVKKGWSSWLDGALFLGLYGMIGLGFWVRVSESP
ncbi:hypothetical protein BDY21DRAFT_189229 [Lineolata rhizophorae]|uniref:Uncharacterized protein n=1 Tax=Lineolata rhizophorae TaxID=578093 RepID=A0A6A6P5S8_9PEZI|nr:hypothetical protein BDY21DRAFT_189229 [Lineolata rhizophorae]